MACKGERIATQNEREFPWIVELPVPPSGLGLQLDFDAIYNFHRECGIEVHRGRGRRLNGVDVVRWCFGSRVDAIAFAKAFGGALGGVL